jgi:chitodextrinase
MCGAAPTTYRWFRCPASRAACVSGAVLALGCTGAVAALPDEASSAAGTTAGPVAAYSFDEGAGTTVVDRSGNGNAGRISGASWSREAVAGRSLSFDGVNDWVTIPDSGSLDLTTGMTVEAWVLPRTSTGWRTVAMKEQPRNLVYGLWANGDTNQPSAYVFVGKQEDVRAGPRLPTGVWRHLATTYDGSTLKLYVDGALAGSRSVAGVIQPSSGPLRLGGNSVWGEWFRGRVDDVRVYARALSPGEIQADMWTPVGKAPTASADGEAPSSPVNVRLTGATRTSTTVAWTASTDNVGVATYELFRDGALAGSTADTSYALSGLACGTSYALGVQARDAAGNASARVSLVVSTNPCPDTKAPTTPSNLTVSGVTANSISLFWSTSFDDVGLVGYGVYRNGTRVASTSLPNATLGGLACGNTYALAVDAYDAAGNRSALSPVSAATSPCAPAPDTQPPTVPQGMAFSGRTETTVSLVWDAAGDDVGVAGYHLYRDGSRVASTQALGYTYTGLACGTSHSFALEAYDAAGNVSNRAEATGTTSTLACAAAPAPPPPPPAPPPPSSPPPSPPAAQLFLAPSGSDADPCTQAAPCRSFDRAYDLAGPGQVVELAGGAYPSQQVTGTKAAPAVVFRPAPGARVEPAGLSVHADQVEFHGLDVRGGYFITGGTHIWLVGGSVGPGVDYHPQIAPWPARTPIRDIVIDGVTFHDWTRTSASVHTECLQIAGGVGVTIRNSVFRDCAVFAVSITEYNGSGPPTDYLIENNVFGSSIGGYYSLQFNSNASALRNILIRNNSSTQAFLIDNGQGTLQNVRVVGNVAPLVAWGCSSRITYSHNVWQGVACAASDRNAAAGFVDAGALDLHLLAGAAAIDAGDPGNSPATDIDGQPRPGGAAPDAGAHEVVLVP